MGREREKEMCEEASKECGREGELQWGVFVVSGVSAVQRAAAKKKKK